ncbi:MAG: RagB/SusD family nutrient uptake outer membrane protein [Tunicatimonas sp.]
MKSYYKYPLLIALLLLAGACEDTLDNVEPTREFEEAYFDSQERVQQSVGAVYGKVVEIYGGSFGGGSTKHITWLLPGDDLTAQNPGVPFDAFETLNSTNDRVAGVWNVLYEIIARANFVLEQIDKPGVQAVYTDPSLLETNRGEVLFLRSWANMWLWDWWRKAPLITERINSLEDAVKPPSTGFELLDQAINDLEAAAPALPVAWDDSQRGRIIRDAAYGMLVKAYTLRAAYDNGNVEDYQRAIAAFEKITTRALAPSFGQNFDINFENNVESLYEYQANENTSQENPFLSNDFGGGVGQMSAYYNYSTRHWSSGSAGANVSPTTKLIAAFEPGDPRQAETFRANPDPDSVATNYFNGQAPANGFWLVKYVLPSRNFITGFGATSTNNPRILRYADVKLLAAEAYFQTGNAVEALEQVNDVRTRARFSTPDGTEAATPANLTAITLEAIFNERFVELAGEMGIRWTDLRRWHAAGYLDLATWGVEEFSYPHGPGSFDFEVPKNLLYPIPQSELETNQVINESGNNPGY